MVLFHAQMFRQSLFIIVTVHKLSTEFSELLPLNKKEKESIYIVIDCRACIWKGRGREELSSQ